MGGSEEPLRVSLTRRDHVTVVTLDGELDCATAPRLASVLRDVVRGPDPTRQLVVDAERLEFVDVAGLHPLLWSASLLPGAFELRNPRPTVLRVIRVLNLTEALGVDA